MLSINNKNDDIFILCNAISLLFNFLIINITFIPILNVIVNYYYYNLYNIYFILLFIYYILLY